MTLLLSILAIVLGAVGTFMPPVLSLLPRLGVFPLYRLSLVRGALAVITLLMALGAYTLAPGTGQVVVGIVTLLLAFLSTRLRPQRIFTGLDMPPHVVASQASLGDNALALGFEMGGAACAWPLEMLAPRHLVNDRLRETPLLVAY